MPGENPILNNPYEEPQRHYSTGVSGELDYAEAFASAYGHTSRPFKVEKGQKIAVRVISQFGEETTKVLTV